MMDIIGFLRFLGNYITNPEIICDFLYWFVAYFVFLVILRDVKEFFYGIFKEFNKRLENESNK